MFDLENRWWRIENTLVGRQQIDGTACLRHSTTKLQVHYTIITRKCARNVVSQQTRPRRVVFIGVKWMMMLPPTFLPEEHSLGSQPDKLNSTFTPPFNYMLTGKCYARRKYNHIFYVLWRESCNKEIPRQSEGLCCESQHAVNVLTSN